MAKPVAVVIADVHYNINTLDLADAAVRTAMRKAEDLKVPLVIAGDLHDTKAILRGECVNRMIDTFKSANCEIILMVGNHCMLNEKSKEHSLEFLRPYARVVDRVRKGLLGDIVFIPYISDAAELKSILDSLPRGSTILAHTGVQTAYMGHYAQDKSSLPPEAFDGFRVISGHYHRRQDIKCGKTGLFSYIGNPYSLNFGEAQDGPKGYQILMSDGSLEFVELPLRRHRVFSLQLSGKELVSHVDHHVFANPGDLVWLKVSGVRSELRTINKVKLGMKLFGHSNYKLDLIPTDQEKLTVPVQDLTNGQIFDLIIDGTGEDEAYRQQLKSLWREIL